MELHEPKVFENGWINAPTRGQSVYFWLLNQHDRTANRLWYSTVVTFDTILRWMPE